MTPRFDPWPWIDRLAGITVGVSLVMAVLTAWPGASHAADPLADHGRRATETREVAEFTAISLDGDIDLKLRQADKTRLTVATDANLLPLLETRVDADKVLRVRWKPGTSVRSRASASIDAQAPAVRSVATAGAGNVEIETMRTPSFALSVAGSGTVRASGLQHDELSIAIAGSGGVRAAGRATRLKISVTGSGDVKAAELEAADVTINVSGSGDAAVHASRSLTASVAGSGAVVYTGSPAVTQAVAGAGSVRRR